ncbi:MAG: rRNA methyltransferase [Rectinemataceae bacterium]|nr:rRNA methyltransferase [Rectinemataceae bacterium]
MTAASPSVTLESLKTGDDCARALDALPGIFDEVVPLTQKHRQELGHTVRSLWEDLTSEKEHRAAEYLSSPAYYSAYIRYFLPWNIIRLASIFGSLPLDLPDEATVIDIGSGPLTLPMALYIARPDLRTKKLTIYCADKTERILKVGQTVFESLCVRLSGNLPPWTILTLHQQFGAHLPEKADLLTGANVFNEFFWKSKAPLGMRALLTARQLLGYLKDSGSIFLMEPGDPRSGSFISSIRAALIAFGVLPLAPCPHGRACPMPGIFRSLSTPGSEPPSGASTKNLPDVRMPKYRDKYPWCHFTIGTEIAPKWLKALSDEAGLSKDKLVFSYLLVKIPDIPLHAALPGQAKKPPAKASHLRVVSEAFPLPDRRMGRYACSEEGYSLVSYSPLASGFASGDLLRMPEARETANQHAAGRQKTRFADTLNIGRKPVPKPSVAARNIDEKSGAIIVSY